MTLKAGRDKEDDPQNINITMCLFLEISEERNTRATNYLVRSNLAIAGRLLMMH